MAAITVEQVRSEFPVAQACRYLDAGYNGILPTRAAKAMSEYVESWCQTPLPGGDFGNWLEQAESVRKKVATLLGVSVDEVFFTRGTTDGLQVVAGAILKSGDELLVGGLEHPADYAIWTHMANRGIQVKIIPPRGGSIVIEDLAAAVGPRTRGIGMCLVNTYNGYRQDLDALSELCARRDLYLFLDGIQALGAVDVDIASSRISVLSAATHKWLCTPRGMGVAYVNKSLVDSVVPIGVWFPHVQPTSEGGWGSFGRRMVEAGQNGLGAQTVKPGSLSYAPSARRFESGVSFLTLMGLEGVVDLLLEAGGMSVVERHVLQLAAYLRATAEEHGHKVLSASDMGSSSGITAIAVSDAPKFAEFCRQRGIFVHPTANVAQRSPATAVRVSTHVFNNREDVDELVATLDSFTAGHAAR